MEPNRPFRWDLLRGDQLGGLLDDTRRPNLWFADHLLECGAKVLARCDDGDLHFVGRSVDSLYDLLSGCLADTSWRGRLHPLPFSLRWMPEPLTREQVMQMRVNLEHDGLAPHELQRRSRPATFVDLVYEGGTFEQLFSFLRTWIDEEGAQWDVVRTKLRFVGITQRKHTSPNTWRWQQHHEWTRQIPSGAIANVSLDRTVWSYLGDSQAKTTKSFRPSRWLDDSVTAPRHDDRARAALAEAVRLFELGQTRRDDLVRLMAKEPAFAEPWLRSLALELRR